MANTATLVKETKWWNGGKSPFNMEYGKMMMWYFLLSDAFTFGAFLISYGTIRFSQNYWPDPNHVFNAFPFAGHANLPLAFASFMTFVLIVSSVTMVLAVHAGHNRSKKDVIKWLWWTIIGGLIFLSSQAWEWTHMLTAEHASLVDGQVALLPMNNGVNPWGVPVTDPAIIAEALKNTPHDILVKVVNQHTHVDVAQLSAQSADQLLGQLNPAEMTLKTKGPIAFGGFFYGITGFHGFHVSIGVLLNIIILIQTYKGVFEKRGHYLMVEKVGLYWHFVDLVWVFVFLCFYLI